MARSFPARLRARVPSLSASGTAMVLWSTSSALTEPAGSASAAAASTWRRIPERRHQRRNMATLPATYLKTTLGLRSAPADFSPSSAPARPRRPGGRARFGVAGHWPAARVRRACGPRRTDQDQILRLRRADLAHGTRPATGCPSPAWCAPPAGASRLRSRSRCSGSAVTDAAAAAGPSPMASKAPNPREDATWRIDQLHRADGVHHRHLRRAAPRPPRSMQARRPPTRTRRSRAPPRPSSPRTASRQALREIALAGASRSSAPCSPPPTRTATGRGTKRSATSCAAMEVLLRVVKSAADVDVFASATAPAATSARVRRRRLAPSRASGGRRGRRRPPADGVDMRLRAEEPVAAVVLLLLRSRAPRLSGARPNPSAAAERRQGRTQPGGGCRARRPRPPRHRARARPTGRDGCSRASDASRRRRGCRTPVLRLTSACLSSLTVRGGRARPPQLAAVDVLRGSSGATLGTHRRGAGPLPSPPQPSDLQARPSRLPRRGGGASRCSRRWSFSWPGGAAPPWDGDGDGAGHGAGDGTAAGQRAPRAAARAARRAADRRAPGRQDASAARLRSSSGEVRPQGDRRRASAPPRAWRSHRSRLQPPPLARGRLALQVLAPAAAAARALGRGDAVRAGRRRRRTTRRRALDQVPKRPLAPRPRRPPPPCA